MSSKQEKLKLFLEMSPSMSKNQAEHYLSLSHWNVQQAINDVIDGNLPEYIPRPSEREASGVTLMKNEQTKKGMFAKYKDPKGDVIELEGIEAFCKDLGIEPTDVEILTFCMYSEATTLGRFTLDEFIRGLTVCRASNIDEMRSAIPRLRNELVESNKTYLFTYSLLLNKGESKLDMEDCIIYWELLMRPQGDKLPLLKQFLKFAEEEKHKFNLISKDTWNMVYDFLLTFNAHRIAEYDTYIHYPPIVDGFVEWLRRSNPT